MQFGISKIKVGFFPIPLFNKFSTKCVMVNIPCDATHKTEIDQDLNPRAFFEIFNTIVFENRTYRYVAEEYFKRSYFLKSIIP